MNNANINAETKMDKEQRFNELIWKYYDTFNEFFPISLVIHQSDEEIIKNIEFCLQTGKPYTEPEFEIDKELVY